MSCFVSKLLTGKDNVESSLNNKLMELYPESVIEVDDGGRVSSFYLKAKSDDFKKRFLEEDWESAEGNKILLKEHPLVLGENGEPKLYTTRTGISYFLNKEGKKEPLNISMFSNTERYDTVRVLMADYLNNSEEKIEDYVEGKVIQNINILNSSIESSIQKNKDVFQKLKFEKTKVEKNKIEAEIKSRIESIKKMQRSKRFLDRVLKNKDVFNYLVKDIKLEFKTVERAYIEEIDERESDSVTASVDLNNLKESDTINSKASSDPEILSLMASIPVLEIDGEHLDATGEYVYVESKNALMPGLSNVHKNSDVWLVLEKSLSNMIAKDVKVSAEQILNSTEKELAELREVYRHADIYERMMDKLKENYNSDKENKILEQLILKLEALVDSKKSTADKEAVKTKFALSFYKARITHTRFTVKDTQRLDASGRSLDIKDLIINDAFDEKSRAKELTGEFLSTIMDVNQLDNFSESVTKDYLFDYIDLGRKSVSQLRLNLETRKGLKLFLNQILKTSLHERTIDDLINHLKLNNIKNTDFITSMMNMDDLIYRVPDEIKALRAKSEKGDKSPIRQLARSYGTLTLELKNKINEVFMDNGGTPSSIRLISDFEAKNNPSAADNTVMMNKSKRWAYTEMSKMEMDILRWKDGDLDQLQMLSRKGNRLVDFLLAKDLGWNKESSKKRIQKLSVKLNTELKMQGDPDAVDFKDLTKEDLHLLTFRLLYEPNEKINHELKSGETKVGNGADLSTLKEEGETNGSIAIHTNADKSTGYSLFGVGIGESNVVMKSSEDENSATLISSIGKENVERAYDMFMGELKKIKAEKMLIDKYLKLENKKEKQTYLFENLISGWHYKPGKKTIVVNGEKKEVDLDYEDDSNEVTQTQFNEGKFMQFGMLNEFYLKNEDSINNLYLNVNKNSVYKKFDQIDESDENIEFKLRESLDEYLTEKTNTEFKKLNSLEGVKNPLDPNKSESSLFGMPTNIIDGHSSKTLHNYILNYMFYSMDMFSIFNGEIGMYVQKDGVFNVKDPFKRTAKIHSTGRLFRNPDPMAIAYYTKFGSKTKTAYKKNSSTVFAVVKDIQYKDSFFSDGINNLLYGRNSKSEDKDGLIEIKGDVADGWSMADPDFLFDFYKNSYGFGEKETKLHNELKDPTVIPTSEHWEFLHRIGGSEQSGKLMSSSIVRKNPISAINFFWKSSVLPLYPALTTGFPIDDVRKLMQSKGVQVVGVESAFKGSTFHSTNIFEGNNEDHTLGSTKAEMDLNPFLVDTIDIKNQVELSAKGEKDMITGNQPQKNILGNMRLDNMQDKVYTHNGVSLNAKQMYAKFDGAVKDVVDHQFKVLLKKIKYDNGSFDESMFRKIIINQFGDLDFDIAEVISDINNPVETIPGLQGRIYPMISSYILKNAAKPRTNGVGAVQVPNLGFNRLGFNSLSKEEKGSVIMLKDVGQLKPPSPTTYFDYIKKATEEQIAALDEQIAIFNDGKSAKKMFSLKSSPLYFKESENENGLNKRNVSLVKLPRYHANIEKAQIMLPFSSLFKSSGMSWEEFSDFMKNRTADTFDEEILKTIIGYRIPNQSMSSNDSFEIVGILPPASGDLAIMYHEITAKTGSDFDIDKMTLMMPNFRIIKKFIKDKSISEENARYAKSVRASYRIAEFMKTDAFENNNDILYLFTNNSEGFRDIMVQNGVTGKSTYKDFFKVMFDKRAEVERAILNDTNTLEIYEEETEYILMDILEDFYAAADLKEDAVNKDLKGRPNDRKSIVKKVEYIKGASYKAKQNRMIESMNSILESSATFEDLITPLDSPYVKNSINRAIYTYSLDKEKLEEFLSLNEKSKDSAVNKFVEESQPSALESMMPSFMVESRVDMLVAKSMTAVMANHMTDIPFSQLKGMFLKYDIGIGSSIFSRIYAKGKEGDKDFKLTKITSNLLDASVDAAKDNYLTRGNFNSYTSGPAMVLERLGMKVNDVFLILNNPLIKKLSDDKVGSVGKISDINTEYKQEKLDEYSAIIAQNINGGDVITAERVRENGFNNKDWENGGMSDSELLGFWNILIKVSQDLNNEIKLSKPETASFKSIEEQNAMNNLFLTSSTISMGFLSEDGKSVINGKKLYDDGINNKVPDLLDDLTTEYDEDGNYVSGFKGTFLGAISNASFLFSKKVSEKMFIEATPGYANLLNRISDALGDPYVTTSAKLGQISKMIYPLVLSESEPNIDAEDNIYNLSQEVVNDLLEDFPKRLLKLKKLAEFKKDAFLQELVINTSGGFVEFKNVKNYAPVAKAAIKGAFSDLYTMEKFSRSKIKPDDGKMTIEERMVNLSESEKLMQGITLDLVRYNFYTTGFKPSGYSYMEYLPKDFFIDNNHASKMGRLLNRFSEVENYTENDNLLSRALMFMASNNPTNKLVVKRLYDSGGMKQKTPIKTSKMLNSLKEKNSKSPSAYKLFVKGTTGTHYMLTDITEEVRGKKVHYYPTYNAINLMELNTFAGIKGQSAAQKKASDKKKRNALHPRLILYNVNMLKDQSIFAEQVAEGVLDERQLSIPERTHVGDLMKEGLFGLEEISLDEIKRQQAESFPKTMDENDIADAMYQTVENMNLTDESNYTSFKRMAFIIKSSDIYYLRENRKTILKNLAILAKTDEDFQGLLKTQSLLTEKCNGL